MSDTNQPGMDSAAPMDKTARSFFERKARRDHCQGFFSDTREGRISKKMNTIHFLIDIQLKKVDALYILKNITEYNYTI